MGKAFLMHLVCTRNNMGNVPESPGVRYWNYSYRGIAQTILTISLFWHMEQTDLLLKSQKTVWTTLCNILNFPVSNTVYQHSIAHQKCSQTWKGFMIKEPFNIKALVILVLKCQTLKDHFNNSVTLIVPSQTAYQPSLVPLFTWLHQTTRTC